MDVEKLLLSKFLLKTGESFIDPNDSMSSGLAISLFQDAVELVLWSVASAIEVNTGEKDGFVAIWQKINAFPGSDKNLPFKEKIFELNKARVGFKHMGILPDPSLSFKYYRYTSEFIQVTVRQFFKIDYDSISLADLIHNKITRNHVKDAEQHLIESNYRPSLISCELAKQEIFKQFERILPEIDTSLEDFGSRIQTIEERDDLRREWSEILSFLGEMRTRVLMNTVNIKSSDFDHYKSIAPSLFITNNGNIHTTFRHQSDTPEEDVQFCIDFVTNTAITVQKEF